jgi:hypothetical protein
VRVRHTLPHPPPRFGGHAAWQVAGGGPQPRPCASGQYLVSLNDRVDISLSDRSQTVVVC